MHRRSLIALALIGLVASTLACNAPTPTPPEDLPSTMTPNFTPTSSPATPLPTDTPEATPTPSTPTATDTPSPTPTPTETPTPTQAISTGPLDFPVPAELDRWRLLDNGEHEATILLHIKGGAPPYTIHHDQSVTITWKTTPEIVFQARGCGALVHTILVESADGQSVKHDYWIPVPWCKD